MPLTIKDDLISGDHTGHTARLIPGSQDAWEVSWLPGQLLDRTTAITAMLLAEVADATNPQPGDRLWPHVEGWAAEIGLSASDALTLVSEPSGRISAEKDVATLAEPEAGS